MGSNISWEFPGNVVTETNTRKWFRRFHVASVINAFGKPDAVYCILDNQVVLASNVESDTRTSPIPEKLERAFKR